MATKTPNDPPVQDKPDEVSRILTPENPDKGNTGLKEQDLNYGAHVDTEEGDSSVRAGSWNKGLKHKRPEAERPQGAPGVDAGYGNFGQGNYGGQKDPFPDSDYKGGNHDEPNRGGSQTTSNEPLALSQPDQNPPISDQGIEQLVTERLSDDPSIDAANINVTVRQGHITLEGTVDSPTTQDAVKDIAEQFGADGVEDQLEVRERPGAEPVRPAER